MNGLQNVALILTVALGFGSIIAYFRRIERKLDFFMIEHEILVNDWQKRNPDERLPTRTRGHNRGWN